jgi:cell pole-organizing protein PopZ
MATASSAQREPSMEEILASIRRIIEDSDGGRRPVEAAEPAPAVEATEDEAATTGSVAPEVDVFRAELRAGGVGPEPKKPISLAEVQAQLAAGQPVPPVSEAAAAPVEAASARPTLAEIGARVAAEQSPDGPVTTGAAAAAGDARFEETAAKPEAFAGSPVAEPELGEIEIGDGDLVFDDEPESEPAARAVLRPTLVSEETGRQVAAAFGELSEAFASRGKKSFDEMAEEMLRPMLQDWLDNNLPTLVERLVREEIERVARGGA